MTDDQFRISPDDVCRIVFGRVIIPLQRRFFREPQSQSINNNNNNDHAFLDEFWSSQQQEQQEELLSQKQRDQLDVVAQAHIQHRETLHQLSQRLSRFD